MLLLFPFILIHHFYCFSFLLQNYIAGKGFTRKYRASAVFIGYKDYVSPPDGLVEKVLGERELGPTQLKVTIAKIKYGNGTFVTEQKLRTLAQTLLPLNPPPPS